MSKVTGQKAPFMRHNLDGSHQAAQSADHYLRPAGRPDWADSTTSPYNKLGTPFPYNGSVTGIAAVIQVLTHTTTGTIDIEVHQINPGSGAATVVATATSPSLTSGGVFEFTWTQDPDIDTFSGSAFNAPCLAIYVNFDTFVGSVKVIGSAELNFDAP